MQLTAPMEKILLTAREAAPLLSISERTILAMAKKDKIPHVRLGSLVRFTRGDLQSWVAEKTQGLNHGRTSV